MKIKSTKKVAAEKTAASKPVKCAVKKCASKCAAKARKCATKKVAVAKAAKKEVTFTLHAERGKKVCVAGEFNKWAPAAKKMAYKARSGIYTATLKLAPGSYQYKFVIDGVWCADPENVNAVANDQGTFNSVIEVK